MNARFAGAPARASNQWLLAPPDSETILPTALVVQVAAAPWEKRGLADVREFGLTREDGERHLSRLGYRTKVDVVEAS